MTLYSKSMCHDGRRESEIVPEKRKKLLIIVCLLTNVDFYLGMLKLVPLAVNRILLKVKLIMLGVCHLGMFESSNF